MSPRTGQEAGAPAAEAAWLGQALDLARDNVADGGGPFGAVVVRDGEVLARGVNLVAPSLDPSAHAEVVAIRRACQVLGDFRLTGCVLVSSCEPCPMCLATALWARVERVVYAADRHDAAAAGFDDRAFYDLFATPREQWAVTVAHVPHARAVAPFTAWGARRDRTDY